MTKKLSVVCLLVFSLLNNVAIADVYRWVDKDGRVHFSDKKNKTDTSMTENLSSQYAQQSRNFEVTVTPINYDLPLDTKIKIITTVNKIFYILNEYNNIPFTEKTNINITIFGSQKEFIAFQKKTSPGATSKTGYYSRKKNQAVVWKNSNNKRMLNVITHEAFHTLLWTNYKNIPTWLNEGFAEYFEQLDVFGTTAVITPNKYWEKITKTALLDKNNAATLLSYLSMDSKQWRELNKDKSMGYAIGWSLAFFLMNTKDGRQLILNIFNERKKNKEALILDIVNEHYTGGLQQLQRNWVGWVFSKKPAHRY